ncbi:kinase-like protein [Coniophora puteana RWD-64-598 SS2]|uniref:Kinase-like protein n=1 Tax=Coniophora puteana (strain RWD-64-598) TaxID=741705 RepID=A0A5M3M8J4_CONPW|nr:kinase-like protein [Coniophora puteana RWD-64-598 SS2]EIW75582.1 kinase-like protein [Coniophora puteana RWD-64-598 SS2]
MSLPWPRRKIQLARLLGVQLPGNANVALRNSTSNSSSKEMCDDSEMREREREREAEAEVERECAEGVVLDRLSHGSSVIGRTSKTAEVDALRFGDQDLSVLGTLEAGQFGVVDVVSCALDGRVYVRKSVEKIFVARHREQCSPQYERDLLLAARATRASWAPHLLCAYQTPTHLRLVMDYLAGGTLWDVLESSPADMRVGERDVKWWAPQMVCAIDWCHAQGFAHRDIKPHNFVLTASRHLQLIDFGSAAPLLPPDPHGTRFIPKQYCMVPCGTCDYISPEILQSYEEALLALEVSDDEDEGSRAYEDESSVEHEREDTWDASRTVGRKKGRRKGNGDRGGGGEGLGYGCETDWWSMGAMLYEMVYGVAPFFASDVKTTYLRIMDHETSLRFNRAIDVSAGLQDLIRRLLTHPEIRLGRHSVLEISEHPFFEDTNWATLEYDSAPDDLLVPEFTYFAPNGTGVLAANLDRSTGSDASQPFAFSALFQSSIITEPSHLNRSSGSSPGLSGLQNSQNASGQKAWIGFSWGPMADAFNHDGSMSAQDLDPSLFQAAPRAPDQTEGDSAWVDQLTTPRPAARPSAPTPSAVPRYGTFAGFPSAGAGADPASPSSLFRTPVRTPFNTFPRTAPRTATTTLRRTAQRREVSDREAMRQLVDCVGMSARKKVLASGRKPRILDSVVRARTRGRGREARERSGSGSASSSAVAVPALLPRSALRPASGGGRVVSASAGNTVRFAPPERERAPSRNLAPIFTASAAGAMAGRIAVNASGTTDSSTRSLSLPDAYGYGLGGLAGLGGRWRRR